MAVVNVNMIQNGLDVTEKTTNYTDQYLKQALANLGQRLSVKGDSIYSGTFKIKDLFPNYLGNFNEEGLCANFLVTKNDDGLFSLEGIINTWEKDPKTGYYRFVEKTGDGYGDDQYKLKIGTINNIIENLGQVGFEGDILLSGNLQINNIPGYFADKTTIIKDNDGYLFKVRGYDDNKLTTVDIFEYIDTKNNLKDAFKIIPNENGGFYLIRLTYVTKETVEFTIHSDKTQYTGYVLSVFDLELQQQFVSDTEEVSDILNSLYDTLLYGESTGSGINPQYTIQEIFDTIELDDTIPFVLTNPIIVPVDFDTEKDTKFSISNDTKKSIQNREVATLIEEEFLNYFSNDCTYLFGRIKEIYNDIKYGGQTNLKIYGEILGHLLITEIYNNLYFQNNKIDETGGSINSFLATIQLDFEISYNVNSNNPNIIYNSINSVTVQYIDKYVGEGYNNVSFLEEDIIDYVNTVSNSIFDDEGQPNNATSILVFGYETKIILYEFTIDYIDDIINNISWYQTFSLPYINTDGYWNINGVDTEIYAYGRDAQKTNFVVLQSQLQNPEDAVVFKTINPNMTAKIIADPYSIENIIPMSDWAPKTCYYPYLDGNDVIGDTGYYVLQAYLPSEEIINKISSNNEFTYLKNSIFVNLLTPSTEKDIWYVEDTKTIEVDNPDYHKEYDEETSSFLWKKYASRKNTLINDIGNRGSFTTFWTLQYNSDTTKYNFEPLKHPDKDIVLDLTYLANISSVVGHYLSNSLEPDKYEHDWLVFSEASRNYKNNIDSSKENSIWPVFMNHTMDYYTGDYDNTNGHYENDLNLTIQYYNNVVTGDDGLISYVGQKDDSRFYTLNKINYTYKVPGDIDDYFASQGEDVKSGTSTYYGLNSIIKAAVGANTYEYLPNASTDTSGKKTNYPLLDLGELFIKDQNTLNRINILGIGRINNPNNISGKSPYIYPLYYSYIGTSCHDDDKSVLHIGTSYFNPNIGDKTATIPATKQQMNKMSKVSIDFDNINLGGNVEIGGKIILNSTNSIWNVTEIDDGIYAYSAIINPVGKHKKQDVRNLSYDITKIYDPIENNGLYQRWNTDLDSNYLFNTLKYKLDGTSVSRATKYYRPELDEVRVSYLNINKILENNDIFRNSYINVISDSQLMYFNSVNKNNKNKISYHLQLSSDLTREENHVMGDIVACNPIQITYIPKVNPEARFEVVEEVIDGIYSYLWPTSYTERWTCPGCPLCYDGNCDKIKKCTYGQVQGYVTYEYGQISTSQLEKLGGVLPPATYTLERYHTIVDTYGGSITTRANAYVYFPNPTSKYVEDTRGYNGISYYHWENNIMIIDGTNPADRPYPGTIPTGKVVFEDFYEDILDLKNPEGRSPSYFYHRVEKGDMYSYTISYTYINDDSQISYSYVYYEYSTMRPADEEYKDQPDKLKNHTHSYFDNDTNSNSYTYVYDYVMVQTYLPVEFSFPTTVDTQKTYYPVLDYYVNVRELYSTHTEPYINNSIASLNPDMKQLGTNKYS